MADVPDHYSTLGVLPSADIEIIRAAYRVLAKRFHPDTTTAPPDEAQKRFRQIQDAYEVLSDDSLRAKHDASRGASANDGDYDTETEETETDAEQETVWQIAVEYFPEAQKHAKELARLSPSLALAFRVTLLRTRDFANTQLIAQQLRGEFLGRYFGQNEGVQRLAEICMLNERRDIAREINLAVKILGLSLSEKICRSNIETKHKIFYEKFFNSEKYYEYENRISKYYMSKFDVNVILFLIFSFVSIFGIIFTSMKFMAV